MSRFVSPCLRRVRNRSVPAKVACVAGVSRAEGLEPRTLLAFTPAGAEFRANTFTASQQINPAIAVDGDGDFVVAWESVNQDGSGWGVFAQRFNAAGAPQGGEFQVNTTAVLNQHNPSVAIDADGDFVIAWGSASFDASTGYDVFAQRHNAAGVRQGGEFRVNNATADAQFNPSVAADADGDFVVAWEDKSRDGSGYGIFARQFNSAGVAQGDDIAVNTITANDQINPSVAMDYVGDFVVAWTTRSASPDVYAARVFDASGAARGGEVTVNPTLTGDVQASVSVGMDPKGNFAVAFPSPQTGVGTKGFVQRFDAGGVPRGSPINLATDRFFDDPSLSTDAAGGFVVTWSAEPGFDDNIYARRYSATGVAQGTQITVNTTLADRQDNPAVGMDGDGDFVIAWQSNGQDGDSYGIYARRYDESTDTAGPVVSDVTVAGARVEPGASAGEVVTSIVLDFSENVSVTGGATGANSATNRANYALTRAGSDVSSQISSVSYGLNALSGKYEATLTFAAPLAGGSYVLTAKQALRDPGGNALDGNFDGTPGGDFTRAFSVRPVVKLGPEFLVNTTTAGNQAEPAVATDGGGNFVVTWQGEGDGGGYGVYAKRYTAAGEALRVPGPFNFNTEFRVNSNTPNNQLNPAVARDATGAFVVAFDSGPLADRDVYAKRYTTGGISSAAEARVNTTTAAGQVTPSVAMDAAGNYVVVWQPTTQGNPIVAQRFNASGVALGGEFAVSQTNTGVFTPVIAMDPGGDFVVAWHVFGPDGSLAGVYARRYDPSGNALGGEFRVNTFTGDNQAYPSVAVDDAGDFVVAWTSYGGQDGSGLGVYAQRYNAAGTPVGGEFRANTTTNLDQSHASVAMDSGGDFVIAWQSYQEAGSNGVYAQRYDASGAPVGGETQVNTTTAGDQVHPSVAMGPAGSFVVAWQSSLQDGSGLGVYAQRFGPNEPPTTSGLADIVVPHDGPDTSMDLFAAFSDSTDADNQLAYAVVGNTNPALVTTFVVTGPTSATLRLHYAAGRSGTATLTVRATDTGGLVTDTSFVVTVVPFGPAGGEFRVNTTTLDNQEGASVASDADGDFVVVWQSASQDGSGQGIFGQRYNAAGVPQGAEFPVNTFTGGSQFIPAVAMDADGDFVVAWTSRGQDGPDDEIYAQRFNAVGERQGAEFRVNVTTAGDQDNPVAAMDVEGDFVIAWQGGMTLTSRDVYARRYDASGVPLGGEFVVNALTDGDQTGAAVAMDTSGDFVVAWTDYASRDGSAAGVYAQRYNATSAPQGANFLVNTFTPGRQKAAAVGMDYDGDFVIAWEDASQDGSIYGVYAQRYAASGAARGGEFLVNTFTTGNQAEPSVALDADGDFVIAWQDQTQDGSQYGIYARHYSAAGVPLGGEIPVNTFTNSYQFFPSVTIDAAGDFVIAWTSYGQDGSKGGVYAQRYDDITDTAGPLVTDVSVGGNPVAPGERLVQPVSSIVLTFSENLGLPRADVALTRNGTAVAIASSTFAFNSASDKYELTLAFTPALGEGSYVLTAGPGLRDVAGNALDGNRDGAPGGTFTRAFTVAIPVRIGPEIPVNTATSGAQFSPVVAVDADGDFVVAWGDYGGHDGSDDGIFARRFNAAGQPLGDQFQVNTFNTGFQVRPDIAADPDGNLVVVWDSAAQDGSGYGVYAQRYDKTGAAVGNEFRVNTTTAGDQETAAVAMDAAGEFVIVWQSLQEGQLTRVYAQRYDASGQPSGGETFVTSTTVGFLAAPSVAIDGNGGFVVAWNARGGTDPSGDGVYAVCYNAASTRLTDNILVNTTTANDQNQPSLATDASGDFVIAWESSNQNGSGTDIYARRFDGSGAPRGGEFLVNTFTAGFQFHPAVGMDADGDFVVTWTDQGQDRSSDDVYGRRYNSAGTPLTGEFLVNSTTASQQSNQAVGVDPGGDFVIAWQTFGQDGDSYGIYARRYAPNQAPTTSGIPAVSVTEDSPDTVVDLFAAFDDTSDADAALTYTIVSNSNPGLFSGTPISASAGTLTLQYAAARTGAATLVVRATDSAGLFVQTPLVVSVAPGAPAVVGRLVFYNDSAADGNDPAATADDDNAIATDKQALLPGGSAGFANVTSYSRGINGVMIDVRHLPASTTSLSAADFDFRSGTGDPAGWAEAPAPSSVTIRRGQGVNGRDRITLVWPDGVLVNTYLRVALPGGAAFGLDQPDVFYFGNLIGETGARNGPLRVDAFDLADTRRNLLSPNPAAKLRYDFNRDGVIDAQDYLLSRANQFHTLPPLAAPATVAAGGAAVLARTSQRPARRSILETPGNLPGE